MLQKCKGVAVMLLVYCAFLFVAEGNLQFCRVKNFKPTLFLMLYCCSFPLYCSDPVLAVDISHGVFHCHLKSFLLQSLFFYSQLLGLIMTTRCLTVTGGSSIGK